MTSCSRSKNLLIDFVADAAANPGLKAAASAVDAAFITPEQEKRGLLALGRLVSSAQDDGNLRHYVRADDIFLLMHTAPTTQLPTVRERWLELTIAGLHTSSSLAERPKEAPDGYDTADPVNDQTDVADGRA